MPGMLGQVVGFVRFFIQPGLDQREVIWMADLLQYFKTFRAGLVERTTSKTVEQRDSRSSIGRPCIDMNHGDNEFCGLLRGRALRLAKNENRKERYRDD